MPEDKKEYRCKSCGRYFQTPSRNHLNYEICPFCGVAHIEVLGGMSDELKKLKQDISTEQYRQEYEGNFDDLMADDTDPVIPFGKHKGKYASDIDVKYLDWLIGEDWLRQELKQQIEAHLRTRPEWLRI